MFSIYFDQVCVLTCFIFLSWRLSPFKNLDIFTFPINQKYYIFFSITWGYNHLVFVILTIGLAIKCWRFRACKHPWCFEWFTLSDSKLCFLQIFTFDNPRYNFIMFILAQNIEEVASTLVNYLVDLFFDIDNVLWVEFVLFIHFLINF